MPSGGGAAPAAAAPAGGAAPAKGEIYNIFFSNFTYCLIVSLSLAEEKKKEEKKEESEEEDDDMGFGKINFLHFYWT